MEKYSERDPERLTNKALRDGHSRRALMVQLCGGDIGACRETSYNATQPVCFSNGGKDSVTVAYLCRTLLHVPWDDAYGPIASIDFFDTSAVKANLTACQSCKQGSRLRLTDNGEYLQRRSAMTKRA